ncbi:tRNA-uridine aminocarboxypropyltransferase [Paenalcaligenes sp. Me131]|uniref:tRNA-uridine aminocarboxypropyltransferase n=1 Tax=Paenalcaligenes sp. Me131 TaxID=3392636 RepID=UPI003D2BC30C
MSESKKAARPMCERCTRPVTHCLCAHISVVPNRIRVLVLQHPDEQKHPLNTARLAVLGLEQAELLVGEHFPQLEEKLAAVGSAFLLFPAKEHSREQPLAAIDKGQSALLVVPDGTWRNARKIIQSNPLLSRLPHLSLPVGEPSSYRVRKATETAAVATIEAIVRTLTVLEPEHDFQPLLTPFNVLVEQQIEAMGAEVYARNYGR